MVLHSIVGYSCGMKNFIRVVMTVALVVAGSACATKKGHYANNTFVKERAHYNVTPPGQGWSAVKIDGADLAWVSEGTGSSLLVNSLCKASEDAPLEALTGHLLIGMTEQNVISQDKLPWSGREALESDILVRVDGVPRRLKTFVLKKDGCVFDIVFVSPPKNFEAQVDAYYRVRDQFSVGSKK